MPAKKKKQPAKFKQPAPKQRDQGQLIGKVIAATLTSSIIMLGSATWMLARTGATERPAYMSYFQVLPVVVGVGSAIVAGSVKGFLHGQRSEAVYAALTSAVLSIVLTALVILLVK